VAATQPAGQTGAQPEDHDRAVRVAPTTNSLRFGPGRGLGPARGPGRAMSVIHALVADHTKIHRAVEDLPDGVRTTTTSDDAAVAALIRTHVRQMKDRVASGRPIRMMDPLFRELFKHYDSIKMEVEEVAGGVRVIETSDDPNVVLLIRQHARRAVSEFVEQGLPRLHEPTPLPEGYQP
jgi:hypothetical protein